MRRAGTIAALLLFLLASSASAQDSNEDAAPTDETPSPDAPVADAPAAGADASHEVPPAEPLAEDTSAEDTAAGDTAAEDTSAEDRADTEGPSDEILATPYPEPVDDAPSLADPVPEPEPVESDDVSAESPPAADNTPASADVVGSSPRTLRGRLFGAWLELGATSGGSDSGHTHFATTAELGLRFGVAESVVADVTWGLITGRMHARGEVEISGSPVAFDEAVMRVDPGNPVFRGLYSGALSSNVHLEVGAGLAVPSAGRAENGSDEPTLARRAASEVSHRAAMAMRGYWSPWRWAPERFGAFVPARLAILLDDVSIEVAAGVGTLVPVLGDSRQPIDVVLQLGAGFGAHLFGPLHAGVRVRAVGGAQGAVVPGTVVSAEPWARLRLDPVQISLRGVVNFNGPDGVAGDRGPAFGVFLAAGVAVD